MAPKPVKCVDTENTSKVVKKTKACSTILRLAPNVISDIVKEVAFGRAALKPAKPTKVQTFKKPLTTVASTSPAQTVKKVLKDTGVPAAVEASSRKQEQAPKPLARKSMKVAKRLFKKTMKTKKSSSVVKAPLATSASKKATRDHKAIDKATMDMIKNFIKENGQTTVTSKTTDVVKIARNVKAQKASAESSLEERSVKKLAKAMKSAIKARGRRSAAKVESTSKSIKKVAPTTKVAAKVKKTVMKAKTRSSITPLTTAEKAKAKVLQHEAKAKAKQEKEKARAKALKERMQAKAKALATKQKEKAKAAAAKAKAKEAAKEAREEERYQKKYKAWQEQEKREVENALAAVAKFEAEEKARTKDRKVVEEDSQEEDSDEEESVAPKTTNKSRPGARPVGVKWGRKSM